MSQPETQQAGIQQPQEDHLSIEQTADSPLIIQCVQNGFIVRYEDSEDAASQQKNEEMEQKIRQKHPNKTVIFKFEEQRLHFAEKN